MRLEPDAPLVGIPVAGIVSVRDATGRAVRATRIRLEAHMSHPGMAPVVGDAVERPDGRHEARLQFTMAGDWTVHVTGRLADGRVLDRWLHVPSVRASQ